MEREFSLLWRFCELFSTCETLLSTAPLASGICSLAYIRNKTNFCCVLPPLPLHTDDPTAVFLRRCSTVWAGMDPSSTNTGAHTVFILKIKIMSFTGTPVSAQLSLDFRSLQLHNHTRPFWSGRCLPVFQWSKRGEVAHFRSGDHHCYRSTSEVPEVSLELG